MKHKVYWDEANVCVRLELIDEFRPEHAVDALRQMTELLEGKPRRFLLIDHRQSPKAVSRETRAALEAHGPAARIERIAFFGMTNLNRVVARIIIAIIGQSSTTQFLASEAEALAWFGDAGLERERG